METKKSKPLNALVEEQKEARKVGRPIEYKPEFCELVTKLCMLGLVDVELADIIGVSEQTFNTWKQQFPEFLESIKKGKVIADAEVASKLFHRATGYEHEEVDVKMHMGTVILTPLVKHYPPDTAAACYWLNNRRRNWSNKQDVDITSGGEKIQSISPYQFVQTAAVQESDDKGE